MKLLRLFLDQMIDNKVVQELIKIGHDVVRADDIGMARKDDSEILAAAVSEKRILITLDEHFGDWVVLPLSQHYGVIRIKANPATSSQIISVILPFLKRNADENFNNTLVIVRPNGVRWINTG